MVDRNKNPGIRVIDIRPETRSRLDEFKISPRKPSYDSIVNFLLDFYWNYNNKEKGEDINDLSCEKEKS